MCVMNWAVLLLVSSVSMAHRRDLHGQDSSACAEVAAPLASSTGCPCSQGGKTPLEIAMSRCKHLRPGREAAPGSCVCWGHALPSPPGVELLPGALQGPVHGPETLPGAGTVHRAHATACVCAQALAPMLSPSPKGKWAPNKVRAGGGGA